NDYPRLGSPVGYITMQSIAEAIKKAGSTDTERLITAFRGLQLDTSFGKIEYRRQDHQATMGAYVGLTTVKNGKGTMRDFRLVDGASVMPTDAEIAEMRPGEANR